MEIEDGRPQVVGREGKEVSRPRVVLAIIMYERQKYNNTYGLPGKICNFEGYVRCEQIFAGHGRFVRRFLKS